MHECHKFLVLEYGKHEYLKLARICSRIQLACFQRPKSCMVPNEPFIERECGADYGSPGDHHFLFGFSYIEKIEQRSILSTSKTTSPVFRQLTKLLDPKNN